RRLPGARPDAPAGAPAPTMRKSRPGGAGHVPGVLVALLGLAPPGATSARRVGDLEAQLPGSPHVDWLFLRGNGDVIAGSPGTTYGDAASRAGVSRELREASGTGYAERVPTAGDAAVVFGHTQMSGATNVED